MIGEIDYEIVVGVIHNFLAIVFFIAIFICGISSSMFMNKGPLWPSFHEHAVYDGELGLFPHQLLADSGSCQVGHWWWCWWCGGGWWWWFGLPLKFEMKWTCPKILLWCR